MITKIEFRASIAPIMSGIRTGGDGLRLTLDIPESDVQDAVALIALRNCPLVVTIEVDNSPVSTRIQRPDNGDKPAEKPKKEKQVKPPKGPHGKYINRLFKQWFFRSKELRHALDCEDLPIEDDDSVKALLAEQFGQSSMSFVSPDELEQWLESHHLTSLVTISRNTPGRYPEPISEVRQ